MTDPITKYIPELKDASKKHGGFDSIKIHHLLNHNSGLDIRACYDSLRTQGIKHIPTSEEMLSQLKYAQILWPPGSKSRYSNGGYSLLGVIIERITGQKFTRYVTQKILQPLGMKTTHYGKSPKKLAKRLGYTYYRDTTGHLQVGQFDKAQGFQEGNGGIKSNLPDMIKFLDFLRFRKRKAFLKKYEKVLK